MRRSLSLPSAGKKKGGNKQEEQKVSLAKLLASYKDFQSGEDVQSGGYKVGAHIAAGADGDVFRAISRAARKEVAVKRIRVTSTVIHRHVHQEISAVFHARKMYTEEVGDPSSTGHPCIVGYLDWFAGQTGLDREVYIAMELCNFGIGDLIHTGNVMRVEYEKMAKSRMPLEQLKAGQAGGKVKLVANIDAKLYRFPEREILKVLFQMLSALAFLNRHGIFHRDVKSENILWRHAHPSEGCYKLADFGVAFSESDNESKRQDDCGTLWTMAPELLGKRPGAGPSCDVWSLACVLFEMSFFEKPFNSLELLAYRNGGAESADGFWNSLCGEKKNASNSAPKWGTFPMSNPSSPSSKNSGACFGSSPSRSSVGGKPSRILTKQASLPSLPSASPKDVSSESPSSQSSSPGKLRKTRTKDTFSLASTDDEPTTPATPFAPASPSSDLRSRRRAFLRKRGGLKWIYSEELRNLIFDQMLEEDTSSRPTPAECMDSSSLQGLLASCDFNGWGTAEDIARCSTLGVSPALRPETSAEPGPEGDGAPPRDTRPLSASGKVARNRRPSTAGAGDCAAAAAAAATAAATGAAFAGTDETCPGNALQRLTPEAFLAVLKVDRKFDPSTFSQQNYDTDACNAALPVLTSSKSVAELS